MNNFRKVLPLFFGLLIPFFAKSQANLSVETGNVLVNPSITVGWYDYGYALDVVNVLPPVGLNVEFCAFDYVTLGAEFEYGVRNYKDLFFTTGGYEYNYQYKGYSLRGSFHYLDLLKNIFGDKIGSLNSEKLDAYVAVSSGLLTTETTQKWNDGTVSANHERKTFDSSIRAGYMAGFRYYFSNNFGAFAELGRNTFGYGKVGLTLKF